MPPEEKVMCETPTPGKKPTRIARWKYDLIRGAILEIVPTEEPGLEFRQLPDLVAKQLTPKQIQELGSVSWYTTTVKLDMEVKGDIERIPGSTPQRLRRTA